VIAEGGRIDIVQIMDRAERAHQEAGDFQGGLHLFVKPAGADIAPVPAIADQVVGNVGAFSEHGQLTEQKIVLRRSGHLETVFRWHGLKKVDTVSTADMMQGRIVHGDGRMGDRIDEKAGCADPPLADGPCENTDLLAIPVDDAALSADCDHVRVRGKGVQRLFHAPRQGDIVGVVAHRIAAVADLQARVQEARKALRLGETADLDTAVPGRERFGDIEAAVIRTVIEHQHPPVPNRLGAEAFQRLGQEVASVLDRQEHVDQRHVDRPSGRPGAGIGPRSVTARAPDCPEPGVSLPSSSGRGRWTGRKGQTSSRYRLHAPWPRLRARKSAPGPEIRRRRSACRRW